MCGRAICGLLFFPVDDKGKGYVWNCDSLGSYPPTNFPPQEALIKMDGDSFARLDLISFMFFFLRGRRYNIAFHSVSPPSFFSTLIAFRVSLQELLFT